MFDDLYPEASEAALTAKAARPPEPQPTQRFSVWGLLSAAPKGVAAGAAQGAASGADLTKAVRDKVPANVSGPLGHIPIMNLAMSAFQVGADVARGPAEGQFTSEVGTSLRNVAKDYTPDPQTTHVAESAVFNLFRVGSKALTAAAAGGNIPGAVIAGAEEGFSTADDLARQGVDIKTRTKVGAVTAATNAVGFALPAAGKTWAQTGALALAGGPVSFMAQNQATREILQNADYSKLADQYDPLDPLGLALSTVLPLGFGALAMRGVKAKGPMPDGSPPPDVPPLKAPDDLVDAARVTLLRENMDATNPVRGDIAQADAHVTAYTRAMDQQANGERVHVDVPEAVAVKATQEMAARVETMRAEVAAIEQANQVEVVAKPDSDFVQAKSEAGLVGGHVRDNALHITTAEVSPDMRGQGNGVRLYSALIDDALNKGLRVFSDSTVEADAVRVYESLGRRGYEVRRLEGGTLDGGAVYGKGAKAPAFEVLAKNESNTAPLRADTAPAATKTVAEIPKVSDFMAERGMVLPDVVDSSAPKGNAFISWLKGAGGVAWSQKVDIVGERGVRGNYAGIFTKNGQNLDTLVESAVQAGYLTRADVDSANDVGGTRALAELIRRATTGEKIPTVENAQASKVQDGQARANMDAADYMERELQALGVDTAPARGNPEVLAAYLTDHREALVNRKLADIDAETTAERIQTGEAFNLTPKQIDQQSRIALANELDENAAYDAAMYARNETDYLNRIEEIIKNDPRSRTTPQGGAGTQADGSIPARDGQATAASRSAADAIPREASASTNGVSARLADIEARNPAALDTLMPVEFDDTGKPTKSVSARDYLEQVKREAQAQEADAGLLQVAANCFLSSGS